MLIKLRGGASRSGWRGASACCLPQFGGLSEQPSLMPSLEWLWPHTVPQGPFDQPREGDQLDGVGEVAGEEMAQAEPWPGV